MQQIPARSLQGLSARATTGCARADGRAQMADAFVIQNADETAGIVVLEKRGMRFYASDPAYYGLDGKLFKNLRTVKQLVDKVHRR
jgi:hypothetical protein